MKVMNGVFLSETLDLAEEYTSAFAPYTDIVKMVRAEEVTDPDRIDFALCWCPAADAFVPFPGMKLVSSVAAGVDNILACPSLPEDVAVMRLRDDTQAQHMTAFALWHIVNAHRNMPAYRQQQVDRLWQKVDYKRAEETRVTILGFGLMGAMLADALVRLGYRVTAFAKRARSDVPEGVILVTEEAGKLAAAQGADILVNLLPATADTQSVIDASLIAAMAKGGTLINLGRGNHLVEQDLLDALESAQLGAAALDVTAIEPLPRDHVFWDHPKITLTPHVAAETGPETLAKLVTEDIQRFQAGVPLRGFVDRARAY